MKKPYIFILTVFLLPMILFSSTENTINASMENLNQAPLFDVAGTKPRPITRPGTIESAICPTCPVFQFLPFRDLWRLAKTSSTFANVIARYAEKFKETLANELVEMFTKFPEQYREFVLTSDNSLAYVEIEIPIEAIHQISLELFKDCTMELYDPISDRPDKYGPACCLEISGGCNPENLKLDDEKANEQLEKQLYNTESLCLIPFKNFEENIGYKEVAINKRGRMYELESHGKLKLKIRNDMLRIFGQNFPLKKYDFFFKAEDKDILSCFPSLKIPENFSTWHHGFKKLNPLTKVPGMKLKFIFGTNNFGEQKFSPQKYIHNGNDFKILYSNLFEKYGNQDYHFELLDERQILMHQQFGLLFEEDHEINPFYSTRKFERQKLEKEQAKNMHQNFKKLHFLESQDLTNFESGYNTQYRPSQFQNKSKQFGAQNYNTFHQEMYHNFDNLRNFPDNQVHNNLQPAHNTHYTSSQYNNEMEQFGAQNYHPDSYTFHQEMYHNSNNLNFPDSQLYNNLQPGYNTQYRPNQPTSNIYAQPQMYQNSQNSAHHHHQPYTKPDDIPNQTETEQNESDLNPNAESFIFKGNFVKK